MAQTPSRRPNVIWILGDQHRSQALGCHGDPNVSTPNLDRMAAEGLDFTAAVAGYPICIPYRASLLTGRYPHQHGILPRTGRGLTAEDRTVAHAFRAAGYRTAYFGKWHVDGLPEGPTPPGFRHAMRIVPPERRGGFEEWTGYENNNSPWDSWVHGGEGPTAFQRRLPGYESDALTELLIDYLRARGREAADEARPFFAVLSVQPPHDPYAAPAPWMARHTPARVGLRPNVPDVAWVRERAQRDLAGYYAQIENLDWNLGRVREALAETGLAFDTHLLFFSDHGDMHGSHGQFRKTGPWEESIRVPFIMGGHIPRYAFRHGRTRALINHVDVAPTTLGLCGIEKPAWMAGADYSGLRLRRQVEEPDSAYLQHIAPVPDADHLDCAWRGVVTRDGWKYLCQERQPWMLFNLNDDPYEQVNLVWNPAHRQERRRLHERLAAWIAQTGDTFPLPPCP